MLVQIFPEVHKALYGIFQTSLLYYKQFKKDIESIQFKKANKTTVGTVDEGDHGQIDEDGRGEAQML
jgi:hypothetical protein